MPGVESIVVSGDRFFNPIRNQMENMEQFDRCSIPLTKAATKRRTRCVPKRIRSRINLNQLMEKVSAKSKTTLKMFQGKVCRLCWGGTSSGGYCLPKILKKWTAPELTKGADVSWMIFVRWSFCRKVWVVWRGLAIHGNPLSSYEDFVICLSSIDLKVFQLGSSTYLLRCL